MRAFKITETGNFMTKLLSGGSFDSFLLEEASLSMQVTWILDGKNCLAQRRRGAEVGSRVPRDRPPPVGRSPRDRRKGNNL